MARLNIPSEIQEAISPSGVVALGRFLEFSTKTTGSPEDAEDRILATLSLSLARKSRRQ